MRKDYNYYKNRKRDWVEAYLDNHNRKFELVRTIASLVTVIVNLFVLLRVFGKI